MLPKIKSKIIIAISCNFLAGFIGLVLFFVVAGMVEFVPPLWRDDAGKSWFQLYFTIFLYIAIFLPTFILERYSFSRVFLDSHFFKLELLFFLFVGLLVFPMILFFTPLIIQVLLFASINALNYVRLLMLLIGSFVGTFISSFILLLILVRFNRFFKHSQ